MNCKLRAKVDNHERKKEIYPQVYTDIPGQKRRGQDVDVKGKGKLSGWGVMVRPVGV